MRPSLIIDESMLQTIIRDRTIGKTIPALGRLGEKLRNMPACSPCQRRSRDDDVNRLLNTAKQTIVALGNDDKRRLKELLKTRQVQITYVNLQRQRVRLKF